MWYEIRLDKKDRMSGWKADVADVCVSGSERETSALYICVCVCSEMKSLGSQWTGLQLFKTQTPPADPQERSQKSSISTFLHALRLMGAISPAVSSLQVSLSQTALIFFFLVANGNMTSNQREKVPKVHRKFSSWQPYHVLK